ncbi:sugar transporter domain-containing protein [Ditylenchus destructor]|nr:sugar transporter domain-containing protein [Ditylenchus destructor]
MTVDCDNGEEETDSMPLEPPALGSVAGKTIPPAYSNYLHLDAEKVLDKCGKYGKYQMLIYGMASLGQFMFVCETMIMSLIAVQPEFSCQTSSELAQNFSFTGLGQTKSSATTATLEGTFKVVDKCTVLDENGQSLECGRGPHSVLMYNESQHITLPIEFDLVCSQEYWTQHGTSLFMIGGMVTTPLLIQLADRYGRKFSFLIPLWLTVLSNIACSLAPTYYYFLFFRFVAGLGTAGIGSIGWVLMIEAVAPSFRSMTPLIGTFVWVGGYMFVGLLHLFIPNWRWLYFAISAPGLLSIAFYWFLPESLHWLITNKKTKQVTRYIRKTTKVNKMEIALHECQSATPENGSDNGSAIGRTYVDMFRTPSLVFHLILHSFIMITMNATYWALSLFSVDLHEDEMVGYFLSGAVEIPAGFLAIVLLMYFGRKAVTFFGLFGQSISMLIVVLFPENKYMAIIFPLLAKGFNSIAWGSEPLIMGEMAPTSVRNMFYGSVGFVGEIGSVLAPYLKVLKGLHESAPPLFICGMSILASLAVLCSPETKDKPMPQDIPDFDAGPMCFTTVLGSRVM